jgi:exodeoxyribonuclease-5
MTDTMTSIFDFATIQPTDCQSKALFEIEEFLGNPSGCQVFVLRGSAGTGKTTLMKTVVEYLKSTDKPFELLAPTAKAAKILSDRTKDIASTIHSMIYRVEETAEGVIKFHEKENQNENPIIYIVDEASMLACERMEEQEDFVAPNPLLIDLMKFVRSGNSQSKLIFIGDIYQLAPFGETESAALSARRMNEIFDVTTQQATLKQVVRQAEGSPILALANEIKRRMDENRDLRYLNIKRLSNSRQAVGAYLQHFDSANAQKVICIACSNKNVQEFNARIRAELKLDQRSLSLGDLVSVHRNWIGKGNLEASKGSTGIVLAVDPATEERMGLLFADTRIEIEGQVIETKVCLNSLISEKGNVPRQKLKDLKADRMAKNEIYRASEKASDDPYMSAMHLRYGYAITCHKAQGSEWETVLVHPKFNINDHRWLYTAVTRASEQVLSWWF